MHVKLYIFKFTIKRNYANYNYKYKYEFCDYYMWKLLLNNKYHIKLVNVCASCSLDTIQKIKYQKVKYIFTQIYVITIVKYLTHYQYWNNKNLNNIIYFSLEIVNITIKLLE